jgi:hypothetical protein
VVIALAVAAPALVEVTGLSVADLPWLATVLAAAGVVARVCQSDAGERLLGLLGLATPGSDRSGIDDSTEDSLS